MWVNALATLLTVEKHIEQVAGGPQTSGKKSIVSTSI